MKQLKVNEILPKTIKEIKSGSELLLLMEIDRYTKEILGKELCIKNISIAEEVMLGEHFTYILRNSNLEFDFEVDKDNLVNYTINTERKYFRGDLTGIVFEKQTEDEWIYTYYTNTRKNLVMNRHTRSSAYVSLFAYMLVTAYKEGKKLPKLTLKNGGTTLQEEMEYVDMLILKNMGNRVLEGLVEIEYARDIEVQPEWEAYVYFQRQRGNMQETSSIVEKYQYTKQNYKVGDVVLYYRTEPRVETKNIRKLVSCYPAVIREIGDKEITFDYYPIVEVKENYTERLKEIEKQFKEPQYTVEDFNTFIRTKETIGYEDVGVDILTNTEDRIILPMQNGVDKFTQRLRDKDGRVRIVEFDTINLTYAVFEDRGVDYNRKRYIEKHFDKGKPEYDIIMGK